MDKDHAQRMVEWLRDSYNWELSCTIYTCNGGLCKKSVVVGHGMVLVVCPTCHMPMQYEGSCLPVKMFERLVLYQETRNTLTKAGADIIALQLAESMQLGPIKDAAHELWMAYRDTKA